MSTLLLLSLGFAHAGDLLIESRVPIEVQLDGTLVAGLAQPSALTLRELTPGPHSLVIYRGGKAFSLDPVVPERGAVRVLVGREMLELDPPEPEPAAQGVASVELRLAGTQPATLTLGEQQHSLRPGQTLRLELPAAHYPLELRSSDRLAVWARGELHLRGGEELVLALSEGRPVECFGAPEAWAPQR